MATKPVTSQSALSQWIHRQWWVVVFIGLCSTVYIHAMKQKNIAYHESVGQLKKLELEKTYAIQEQEELSLQIQSQSDPAWVEMVLKRNLGMVPEGQTKVYFYPE